MDGDAAQAQAIFHHQDRFAQLGGLHGSATAGWPRTDDDEIEMFQRRPLDPTVQTKPQR